MNRRANQGAPEKFTMGRWNRVMVVLLGILLVSWGGPAASAFWTTVSSNAGGAKADTVAQGAKPVATVGLAGNVTVTWAASSTAAGKPVAGYSISRYTSASGGTKVAGSGTCTGTVSALSCTDTATTGTWYYAVTPMISQWQGSESLRSTATTVDATAPNAPSVNAPTLITASNVSNVSVTGTAEANSTIVLTVTDAGAAHTVTQTRTANGSGSWSTSGLNLSTLNDGTITYSARATDAAGNTSQPGLDTSSKDATAPTVTNIQLGNGGGNLGKVEENDTITVTYSEALDASKVCSAWSSDTATQTISGSNQVTVTINSSDSLTVSVTNSACNTFRFGTVSLGKDYENSGSVTFRGSSTSASVLVWNPTTKTLTITLGALSSGSPNTTAQGAAAAKFTPSSGLSDIAGNALSTSQFISPNATSF
ncbi:Ig-like domain-containing protein [Paenarthrobacter sp. NPDC090520]|uniref:Ig-like domain-containing protein n=1 Tax=Paenarthrobacter sp. NPDC090520 TaxID=3364382 RepID=UPI00380FD54A